MNVKDIQRVNLLTAERDAIQNALGRLATGGRISSMTVSGGKGPAMPPATRFPMSLNSVPTGYIDYPPQMIEAITTALKGRLTAISQELTTLGVQGAA